MITIVTPTYNRTKYLPRLYTSLIKQTNMNFEWIVVDDGSIDDTEGLIKDFKNENIINIIYLKKENGGKHTALNLGVELSNFPYIFIVDSDDTLPENSIKVIIEKIEEASLRADYKTIAGICGNKANLNGQVVGNVMDDEIVCSYMDFRYKYEISGDKAEVFKTEILKKYRFPVFDNEKFCPEALIWNRISKNYDMYFFNKTIYFCEYLEGGLTDQILIVRKKSPNATLLYYYELSECYKIKFKYRVRGYLNYWRFFYISNKNNIKKEIKFPEGFVSFLCKFFVLFLFYLGFLKR
ncbi:glycosyltransferase family 2 protein [Acinetobacter lwoffii]|uniref:glycosyltransferase family 2 protein n=1 Tax=Acinetobacter lwoffii TaxID=28090 RepID=UPI00209B6BD5|nr:glycosyltransferase family 2 protein [Acinetobacter lwoffii]MCO8074282.1 glycosyltransferase family 2 protein [Acinetobacter lwoffii]MCO8077235.1 glycosyltransferase family 2 protein [Acinetobacter lwoffii]